MADEKMVKVTNRNVGPTGYEIDDGRIRRRFEKGETKIVPYSELETLAVTPGGEKILRNYLVIDDETTLNKLNIEAEQEYFYGEDDVKRILEEGSLEELEDTLNFAPKGVIEILKKKAIEIELPDIRKRKLIFEKTGLNIDNALMINEVMNEEDSNEVKDEKPVRKATTTSAPERKYKVVSK